MPRIGTITLTLATGESRDGELWDQGDGTQAIVCPFCGTATIVGAHRGLICLNPACDLNATREIIERRQQERAEREREKQERERNNRIWWQMQQEREQERARTQAEAIAKAKKQGSCLNCLFDNYGRIKYIRHRGQCPKARH